MTRERNVNGTRRRGATAVATAVMAVLLVAPGIGATRAPKPPPAPTGATVFGAASLTEVFRAMAPKNTYNLAGSDQLAFQIEQGAPADVFAAASPKYPDDLYAKKVVFHPHVFATNRVVVIVPASNPARIRSIYDLKNPGVKLVIGDPNVPIGAYTRTAFKALGLNAALANVVSNEQDVKAVVAKVALGEADAGLAYITDVRPVRTKVKAIAIPAAGQPLVEYEVAVVRNARHRAAASAFVRYLLTAPGRAALDRAGFGLPGRG
jgi:molybdate transport system substrate-binding protein